MSLVEQEYNRLIDQLTPAQKMRRMEELLHWTRSLIARQIQREHPEICEEDLKWEVATRMYGSDDRFCELLKLRDKRVPT